MDGNTATDATPSESMDEGLDHSEELTDNEDLESSTGEGDESQTQESEGEGPRAKGAPAKKAEKKPQGKGDEFEEVSIGSVKAKLPKDVAKAIKDLERGSQTKMQEAAAERKKAAAILHLAKSNPDEFFRLTGIDADEFAESRLAQKYERQMMSPEQRELADLKAEKSAREQAEMSSKADLIAELEQIVGSKAPDEIKQLSKEKLAQILENQKQAMGQEQQALDSEIGQAWTESGLPKHKYFVQLMAATMLSHQRRTKEPLQAKEAAAIVKRDFLKSVSEVFGDMDPQGILEAIGPQTEKKIREFLVARATGRAPASAMKDQKRPGQAPASQKITKTQPMNEFEYREYLKTFRNELSD